MKKLYVLFLSFALLLLCGSSRPNYESAYEKGKRCWGEIKIITYGVADFEVRYETIAPDLRVKIVNVPASGPGEWRLVDVAPQWTVKFVDVNPDFTVCFE